MVGSAVNAAQPHTHPAPIMNAVLAYMRHLMFTREKIYVHEAICARFPLKAIKSAHEVISKVCDPTKHYGYRGPIKCRKV